jgi:hypothetical protein
LERGKESMKISVPESVNLAGIRTRNIPNTNHERSTSRMDFSVSFWNYKYRMFILTSIQELER